MQIQDIRTLYAFNRWADERILNAAAGVPEEQFSMAALGACNLRDTLTHMVVAQNLWRLRWTGHDPYTASFPTSFPTLAALREHWQQLQAGLDAFIATLDDAELNRERHYKMRLGEIACPLWQSMLQLVTHGTQHRAELALLLTTLDRSPGDLDLIVFVMQGGGGRAVRE